MGFNFEIRWKYKGIKPGEIDPVFFSLLRAIRLKGSLRSAAEDTGISYRHAWGLVQYWTECLSSPIVKLEQGRGARLTEVGDKLLWAEQLIQSKLSPGLNEVTEELNREFNHLLKIKKKSSKIRIYASHDLAISSLHIILNESKLFDVDFHFKGSLESLHELANGQCDIAGFHIPTGDISSKLAPLYLQWLAKDKHKLILISTRQQGLIVNKKNPHKITGLKGLMRRSVRFVNRQQESGTRTIFDELINIAGINKSDIKGYNDEEFTHSAVAALIASGAADAGFGIKAVTGKFGLHFIPVINENYILAINNNVPEKFILGLKKLLKSRQFKSRVNSLSGYNFSSCGNEASFNELFNDSQTTGSD